MSLEGKVAVITGGGRGIGEATALAFAHAGATVAVADLDAGLAGTVAAAITATGGRASAHAVDVSDRQAVEATMAAVVQRHGSLDILINNAGINRDALAKKMDAARWDQVIAVNLTGTWNCAQAAARPMMEARSGRIVNTASVGVRGNVGQANYSASKAGVIGLTRTLALELARYGINVNCIAPGATATPMLAGIPAEMAQGLKERIPLGRFALPEEIAQVHLFLCGDGAAYITGQVLFVDGGLSIGL